MQQTSWNLCPTVGSDIKYSAGCYFPQDNRFNSLSGSYSKILDDLPDGEWTLMMRRDIFKKTRGSIIDYDQVCFFEMHRKKEGAFCQSKARPVLHSLCFCVVCLSGAIVDLLCFSCTLT